MLIRNLTFFAAAFWASVAQAGDMVVVDARPLSECGRGSVIEARCLPAEDFFAPNGRLANFRDVLWMLGTVGLDGSESVAVLGDDGNAKDVVAAILFLAGQRSVTAVVARPDEAGSPGRQRGMTREKVYEAAMRDDRIVLPHETRAGSVIAAADDRSALVQFAAAYGRDDAVRVLLGGAGEHGAVSRQWWWLVVAAAGVIAVIIRWRKARCNC